MPSAQLTIAPQAICRGGGEKFFSGGTGAYFRGPISFWTGMGHDRHSKIKYSKKISDRTCVGQRLNTDVYLTPSSRQNLFSIFILKFL